MVASWPCGVSGPQSLVSHRWVGSQTPDARQTLAVLAAFKEITSRHWLKAALENLKLSNQQSKCYDKYVLTSTPLPSSGFNWIGMFVIQPEVNRVCGVDHQDPGLTACVWTIIGLTS